MKTLCQALSYMHAKKARLVSYQCSHKRFVLRLPLTTIDYLLSAIYYLLSTICYRLSAIYHLPPAIDAHPLGGTLTLTLTLTLRSMLTH